MNKIKSLILAACAFPAMAYAVDYPWLTFSMTDGSEISVAAEGLTINYSEGNLLLKSATVDQSLATNQVASMRFTTFEAGVEGINDILSSEADYFDLSGKKAGRFSSSEQARKILPSGIYIVRTKDKTIKVIF